MIATLVPFFNIFANAAAEQTAQGGSSIRLLMGNFGIDGPFLLAQIINFVLVAFVLYRFAFKPVLITMEQRQKKIADGLQYAEEMKLRLAEAEKRYDEMLKEAARGAQQIMDGARETAREYQEKHAKQTARSCELMLKKAEEGIVLERTKMLADLKKEVSDLVAELSIRVMGKTLSDQQRAVFTESAAKEVIFK